LTDFVHRTQVVKKIDRFKNLEPVIQLPTGDNFRADVGVAAGSGEATERTEIRDTAAEKKSTRLRTAPKRYGFE
jgi:hypothetical protein